MTENRHNPSRRSFRHTRRWRGVSLALSTGCSRRDWVYATTAGRLTARPHESRKSYVSGRTTLGLDSARDAISANAQMRTQLKLPAVGLLSRCRHGAGRPEQSARTRCLTISARRPKKRVSQCWPPISRDSTWDAISGSFEPDVKFLNRALELVFEMLAIDARRILGNRGQACDSAILLDATWR
jgi:hypothetical protein